MTSRRVSLEVVVDDADERLCGEGCPGYGSDAEDDCTIFHADHDYYTPEGRAFRHPGCLAATALASADDAVLEAAEVVTRECNASHGFAHWDAMKAAIDVRRKLRGGKSE